MSNTNKEIEQIALTVYPEKIGRRYNTVDSGYSTIDFNDESRKKWIEGYKFASQFKPQPIENNIAIWDNEDMKMFSVFCELDKEYHKTKTADDLLEEYAERLYPNCKISI